MSERVISKRRSAVFIDLGVMEYGRALDLQIKTLESKIDNPLSEDSIFFVQHFPVFTLGKRGGEENLVVSRNFLKQKKIDLVSTDRGGNITYHGPGQAVLYPIINLERQKIGVKDFVFGLEEIMKQTALDFNIDADRNQLNQGLWVGNSKIGSVGISVKKGISYHGLAMNINLDLKPFTWIKPCGLAHITMTSFENEIKKAGGEFSISSMTLIKDVFKKHFSSVFHYDICEPHVDR